MSFFLLGFGCVGALISAHRFFMSDTVPAEHRKDVALFAFIGFMVSVSLVAFSLGAIFHQ